MKQYIKAYNVHSDMPKLIDDEVTNDVTTWSSEFLTEKIKEYALQVCGPIGELRYFPSTDYQYGFLFCDGSIFLKEVYPEFFTFWKIHFEKKCGYDRFGNPRLPDFRGKYIRGSNEGDNVFDSENESLPNIRGRIRTYTINGSTYGDYSGEFYEEVSKSAQGAKFEGTDYIQWIYSNAHRYNSIYGRQKGFNADNPEHVIVNNINSNIYIKVI